MATLSLKKTTPRVEAMRQSTAGMNDGKAMDWIRKFPVFRSVKPLKIGAGQELVKLAPMGLRQAVRRNVRRWCQKNDYQRVLAQGGHRFGLNGMPDGQVTAEEQACALKRLNK